MAPLNDLEIKTKSSKDDDAKKKLAQIKNYLNKEKEKNIYLNTQTAEIQKIKSGMNKINNDDSYLENCKPGEKIIAAHFISTDQLVDFSIPCKNTDLFVRLEEKLYNEYPQYKKSNTFFTAGGKLVERNKTMSENKIDTGIKILLNVIE